MESSNIRPLTREEQLRTYLENLKIMLQGIQAEINQAEEELKILKLEKKVQR